MRQLMHWLFFAVLPLLLACGSPIVGAQCKKGYVRCDGRCVKLDDDPQQCGACGNDCGRFACVAGECSTTKLRPDAGLDAGPMSTEGGARDGAMGSKLDSGRGDGGIGRGGSGTPFLPDGGVKFPDPKAMTSCGIGQTACGDACADLRSDPMHCGDCGTGCPSDQFCQMGMCVNICDAPLTLCNGGCVDEQIDENNCGGCNKVCVSGICSAGVCADAVPGSLVVIGHDYTGTVPPAMQQIAGNAVFLARGSTVRGLVYGGAADPASVDGVDRAIGSVVTLNGRHWEAVPVDSESVSARLRDVSAFVIEAQVGATDDELTALGEKWALALSQFLFRGGVVILFETQSTKNSGTYKVLAPAGLFLADSREAIDKQDLKVNSGVNVANGITTTYTSGLSSVRFLNIQTDGTTIVKDRDGETVVFHSVAILP